MFDLGYFYGCSLAKHATCLIQDLATYNPSLDALYLKHTDSSSLITAAVTPTELWTLKHLQFTNAEFHTGVSWLRSALLPKTAASRFLNQISVSPVELPSRSMLRHATLWFGLWTNTFPDLLRTDLEWLDVEGSRAVELWDRPQSPSIVVGSISSVCIPELRLMLADSSTGQTAQGHDTHVRHHSTSRSLLHSFSLLHRTRAIAT